MMTLLYAFTDPADNDRYGMNLPELVEDQADAEHAGYACGVCLDDEFLTYTDGTDSPCPACRPRLLNDSNPATDASRRNPL